MAVRPPHAVRCRYCHREFGPADVFRCDHCGANVCDRCGGVRDNPSGHGLLCTICHEAAVEWRARWHMRADVDTINPLNM